MNKTDDQNQAMANKKMNRADMDAIKPERNGPITCKRDIFWKSLYVTAALLWIALPIQLFAYPDGSVKSESNQRSAEEIEGLFYTVQIGVYSGYFDHEAFADTEELLTLELPDGHVRYSIGVFPTEREAATTLAEILGGGLSDAFLAAYYNGERITLSEARRIGKSLERSDQLNRYTEEAGNVMSSGQVQHRVTADTLRNTVRSPLQSSSEPVKVDTIPYTEGMTLPMESDTLYSVQIGIFTQRLAEEELKEYEPWVVEELPDGSFKYLSGLFTTEEQAENYLLSMEQMPEQERVEGAQVISFQKDEQPQLLENYQIMLVAAEISAALQEASGITEEAEAESFERTEQVVVEQEEVMEHLAERADSVDVVPPLGEEMDEILADTSLVEETIYADFTDEIQDTVEIVTEVDLRLSALHVPEAVMADSLFSIVLKLDNEGDSLLASGAFLIVESPQVLLLGAECTTGVENSCSEETLQWNEPENSFLLPELESEAVFELILKGRAETTGDLAEVYARILLPEGVEARNPEEGELFLTLPVLTPEPVVVEEPEAVDVAEEVAEVIPEGIPFLITLDQELLFVDESSLEEEERERVQSLRDFRSSIQIRADYREQTPFLNITAPGAAVRNQPMFFHGYTNYAAWIDRYELRIFDRNTPSTGQPIALVSPADDAGTLFRWSARVPEWIDAVQFVLRVYDRDGNFDETRPRELAIVDRPRPERDRESDVRESRIGFGENSRSIVNIPVRGGAVTVTGENLDPNSSVIVSGRPVPVDENGRFVSRQLRAPGTHLFSVAIDDPVEGYIFFNREVFMPRRDWFSLGIADFTFGMGSVSGPASLVTGNNSARYRGDEFVEGRLAFYVKGDLTNSTTLTASADTREQPVSQLFTNFTERDPLALLRRLDSNYSYPVYGDDAILIDDAPTQGKFHVRLEREDSRLMWGSFRTPVAGTDLVRFNRGLYGAELHHRSLSSTQYGERRTSLDAFAADPGTVGSREEFRATGGSLYYLRNQDVLLGSERVFVEIRDRESGLVLESITLQAFQDYELNALQGRILLSRPLSSIQQADGLVRTGAVSGNPVYLVVNYEYTPTLLKLDNFTMGGRVSQWIGDYVQIGLTGYSQQGIDIEQDIYGGDVTLRIRPDSYIRVEHANSEGRGAPVWSSVDGGFGFEQLATSAERSTNATAQRAEMGLALSDFNDNGRNGNVSAYWQRRGDGFSAPGQLNTEEINQAGLQARLPLGSRLSLQAKGDLMEGSRSGESRAMEAGAELFLTRRFYVQAGARNEFRETGMAGGNSARLSETGVRTDAVGLLGYQSVREDGTKGPFNIYGLLQGTLDKDEGRRSNDRYGLGAGLRISDRVTLTGEASDGDGGWGGLAEAEFSVTNRTSFYLNYLMDPDRTDQGIRGRSSNLTTGGRVRYSESTNVFVERRQETAQVGPTGLMHAFGLDLAPSDRWSYGLKLEAGSLSDPAFGDVDRKAASLFAGFTSARFKWGGALEYRTEESSERGKRDSWLARNTLGVQLSDGWRILGRANIAVSDGGEGTVMDAEYTELVAGLAYRPVYRNRVNGLFRYSYLYDLASPDQLGPRLQLNPFAQKSHVFSADAIFKITRHLSLGGKIGHRRGELRDRTIEDSEWFGSSAWLYIARADIHVVRAWDFIAEYRRLEVEESQDVRDGYLIGLYRHVNTNLRLGIGYNFTDYTDDLTDLSFRSRGWFVNLIGMF